MLHVDPRGRRQCRRRRGRHRRDAGPRGTRERRHRRFALVGQERHLQRFTASEEHAARDGLRAETVADTIERRIDGRRRHAVERQGHLDPSSADRLLKVMPMSVMPRLAIIGKVSPRRTRPVVSNASVSTVASGRVWDLVARERSSNRRRSVTVRQIRCAFRKRCASRSTSAIRSVSSMPGDLARRPRARCVPMECRRRPTSIRRGSRLWASA